MSDIKKMLPSALEMLRRKKRSYESFPSKEVSNELILAVRNAFAEAKSFVAVNKVLGLISSINLDTVKSMAESGRRSALELARVEIALLEKIEDLSPYLGSPDVRVADLAKTRRNQLRQKKPSKKD